MRYIHSKKQLINSYVSYRCIYRNCKASIKITIENAKKINCKGEDNDPIDYTLIGIHANENYQRRTNIIWESFHKTLNNIINHNHPNIAYLVDKLKYFAIEAYKKYTASLISNKPL